MTRTRISYYILGLVVSHTCCPKGSSALALNPTPAVNVRLHSLIAHLAPLDTTPRCKGTASAPGATGGASRVYGAQRAAARGNSGAGRVVVTWKEEPGAASRAPS